MKKRLRSFLLVGLMFSASQLFAQSWEEYKKQEDENFRKFKIEQQNCINKLRTEFQEYVSKQDKEFSDYLKKEWENYQVFAGILPPSKPKPNVIPTYIPPTQPRDDHKPFTIKPKPSNLVPTFSPDLVQKPPIRMPVLPIKDESNASINYYGVPVYLDFDRNMAVQISDKTDQSVIGSFWDKASASNYISLISQLLQAKAEMNLNDYGYYLLVQKFSQDLYPGNENMTNLMTWFIMVRSGFGVKIASAGDQLTILLPSVNQVYAKPYLVINGMKYYIMSQTENKSIQTYDKDYEGSSLPVDFNLYKPINLGQNQSVKTVSFNYKNKDYHVKVAYDAGLINYYNDFPQLEMSVYFNAAVSLTAKESLTSSFAPLLSGMNQTEAVNFLLHFVQTAFRYKTDPEQFGYEKFFFAEELFNYPFSDCEDRSVLFSYLVRELTGLKVIGLEYPGHVATAVKVDGAAQGDFLNYKGEKYIIADATYINAPAGLTMPGFRDLQPTVVDINSLQNTEVHQNKLWDLAETSGLHQGSNLNNMLAFADGSSVFTGYFSETVQFGGKTISSNSKNNVCFIAKTKSTGEIIWNNSLESTANAVGLAVAHDKQGNVFLAGSFSGNLEVANQILSIPKGKTDVFVACYGNTGTLKWIKKAGLDSLPQDISMAFSIEFTSAGMRKSFVLSEAYPDFQNYGLSTGNDGTIIYSGISSQVIASVETPNIAYASSMDLNIPELLKLENDRLLKQQTDKSIAGLIAAINLVKNSGIDISGLYARQALDKYNPGFKKNCPNLYKNLGKIKFVKNNRGIITMLTENGEDVLFDKIKVKDKSTLTISTNGNGDIQMDILSGIKVGKMVVWYPLNSIHVYKNSGDLLFDYDTDHSQQKLSMRKDILK